MRRLEVHRRHVAAAVALLVLLVIVSASPEWSSVVMSWGMVVVLLIAVVHAFESRTPRSVLIVPLLAGILLARYVSLAPDQPHTFALGPNDWRGAPVTTPTLLGWFLPGRRPEMLGVQFSADGRAIWVLAARGPRDSLATASAVRPRADRLEVDLRMTGDPPVPFAQTANLLFFSATIALEPPVDPQHPPMVINVGTGAPLPIGPTLDGETVR